MIDTVFVTQTGTKYHSRTDETCLENARAIRSIDLGTAADGGLVPCIVCGAPPLPGLGEADSRWLRSIDSWAKDNVFDTLWEQAFARRVLARVANLSSDSVEPQAYVTTSDGTLKVDFLISNRNIVIEVDGFQKDGEAPSAIDVERRNRRDSALQSSGFRILHFTNAQVQQEPDECRRQVESYMQAGHQSETRQSVANEVVSQKPGPVLGVDSKRNVVHSSNSFRSPARWIAIAVGSAVVLIAAALFALSGLGSANTSSTSDPQLAPEGPQITQPINGNCPVEAPIKGNINRDTGEKIFHEPGQQFYGVTEAEGCFATGREAEMAGFRKSKR